MALRFAPGRYELVTPAGASHVADLTAEQALQIRAVALQLGRSGTTTFRCLAMIEGGGAAAPPLNATFAAMLALAPSRL